MAKFLTSIRSKGIRAYLNLVTTTKYSNRCVEQATQAREGIFALLAVDHRSWKLNRRANLEWRPETEKTVQPVERNESKIIIAYDTAATWHAEEVIVPMIFSACRSRRCRVVRISFMNKACDQKCMSCREWRWCLPLSLGSALDVLDSWGHVQRR